MHCAIKVICESTSFPEPIVYNFVSSGDRSAYIVSSLLKSVVATTPHGHQVDVVVQLFSRGIYKNRNDFLRCIRVFVLGRLSAPYVHHEAFESFFAE